MKSIDHDRECIINLIKTFFSRPIIFLVSPCVSSYLYRFNFILTVAWAFESRESFLRNRTWTVFDEDRRGVKPQPKTLHDRLETFVVSKSFVRNKKSVVIETIACKEERTGWRTKLTFLFPFFIGRSFKTVKKIEMYFAISAWIFISLFWFCEFFFFLFVRCLIDWLRSILGIRKPNRKMVLV